jgi:hypothetical protein
MKKSKITSCTNLAFVCSVAYAHGGCSDHKEKNAAIITIDF